MHVFVTGILGWVGSAVVASGLAKLAEGRLATEADRPAPDIPAMAASGERTRAAIGWQPNGPNLLTDVDHPGYHAQPGEGEPT